MPSADCMRLFSRVSCQRWISRAWRLRMGLFLWAAFIATVAHAGPQREEPLIDSVRTALSAAVHPSGPPTLVHADAKAAQMFQQWLTEMEVRLDKQLQARKSSALPSSLGIAESSARAMPDLLPTNWLAPICGVSSYKPFGTKANAQVWSPRCFWALSK